MSIIAFFWLTCLAVFKFFKALVSALLSVLQAAFTAFASLVTSIALSPVALISLFVSGALLLSGMVILYNPEFAMRSMDTVWECAGYPAVDYSLTYAIRPFKEFAYIPLTGYANRMINVVKDGAGDMVDAWIDIGDRPGFSEQDFTDAFDALWDFAVYKVLELPYSVDPPLWGPDQLELPFEYNIIKYGTLMATDVGIINRHSFTALKNLTMSAIRGDTFDESCFMQTIKIPNSNKWAFEGCHFIKSTCTNHDTGCAGCHNITGDFAANFGPNALHLIPWIVTNFTAELESLMLSLQAVDVCPALLSGTCSIVAGQPTLDNYNCSKIPWWVKPDTFPQLHCLNDESKDGIVAPQLGTGCALRNRCASPPAPTQCARVDGTMAFKGMTCAHVLAASNGLLGADSCVTMDDPDCRLHNGAYWTNKVARALGSIFHEVGYAMQKTSACMLDWVKTWWVFGVMVFDKGCTATPKEIAQFFIYDNLWSWTGCSRFLWELIFRDDLKPIANAWYQGWQLLGEVGTSVIDGSIVTKSEFFCNALQAPVRGCDAFALSYDTFGCTNVTSNALFAGSPSGLLLKGVRCSAAGFDRRCTTTSPCAPIYGDDVTCDWFAGKNCFDVTYNTVPSIIIQSYKCPALAGSCVFRGDGSTDPDQCKIFGGCRMTSHGDNCQGQLHTYTQRFFWIVNGTLSNLTSNVFGPGDGGIYGFEGLHDAFSTSELIAVIEGLTSKASCLVDSLKGVFGTIVLTVDPNCYATFGDATNYFVSTVISDGLSCLKEVGDIMRGFGWDTVADLFNRAVDIVADSLPHLWTGAIFHSDTYYCNAEIEVKLLDDQSPFYRWSGVRYRGWAYEGCNTMSGGECVASWEMCVSGTPSFCGCPDCTAPFNEAIPWGYDVIEAMANATISALRLDEVPFLLDVANAMLDITHSVMFFIERITVEYVEDIIGFFILVCDGGCLAGQGEPAGMFFLQNVLLKVPVAILNLFIDVGSALWDLGVSFFSMIGDLIWYIIKSTGILDFIFSAMEDTATIQYCFAESHNPANEWEAKIFYYPPMIPGYWSSQDMAPYNFTGCIAAWPHDYTMDLQTYSCDLSGCFSRAWTCLKYTNISGPQASWVHRDMGWMGTMVQSDFTKGTVTGLMNVVDGVVCPFMCIKKCKYCRTIKKLGCFFRCLVNTDYECSSSDDDPDDNYGVLTPIMEYDCPTKCSCDTPEAQIACYGDCYRMRGYETYAHQMLCNQTFDGMSIACHEQIDTDVSDAVQVFKSFISFTLDPYGRIVISFTGLQSPGPLCNEFSSIYLHNEVFTVTMQNSPHTMDQYVYSVYTEALTFCQAKCPISNGELYMSYLERQRACMVVRMLMYNKNFPPANNINAPPPNNLADFFNDILGLPFGLEVITDYNTLYCAARATNLEDGTSYFHNIGNYNVMAFLNSFHCNYIDCTANYFMKRLLSLVMLYSATGDSITVSCDAPGCPFAGDGCVYTATSNWWYNAYDSDCSTFRYGYRPIGGGFQSGSYPNNVPNLPGNYPFPSDGPLVGHGLRDETPVDWSSSDDFNMTELVIKLEGWLHDLMPRNDAGEQTYLVNASGHVYKRNLETLRLSSTESTSSSSSAPRRLSSWTERSYGLGCTCQSVLSGKAPPVSRIVDRMAMQYCKTAFLTLAENPDDPEAIEAYCLRTETEMMEDASNGVNLMNVFRGARYLSSPPSHSGHSSPRSRFSEDVREFVATEVMEGLDSGSINANAVEDTKSAIGSAFNSLWNIYNGSVVQNILNDGHQMWYSPNRTDQDVDDWGRRSMEKLFGWSLTVESTLPPEKNHTGSVAKLRKMLGKLSGNENHPAVTAVTSRRLQKRIRTPHEEEVAPTAPTDTQRSLLEATAEAVVLEKLVDSVFGGRPMARWRESGEEKEYLFFKNSEKIGISIQGHMDNMATIIQQHYHETSQRMAQSTSPQTYGSKSRMVSANGNEKMLVGEVPRTTPPASDSLINWDYIADQLLDLTQDVIRDIASFFDKGSFKDLANDAWRQTRKILICKSPQQYNGTSVYNVFCFNIPMGLFAWVPAEGDYFEPLQIPWGEELITKPCLKWDYPEGERPYWKTHPSNCEGGPSNYSEYTHIGCPSCDYCKREYNPYVVRMDTLDTFLFTIAIVFKGVNQLTSPSFADGYVATFADCVHFAINMGLLFGVTALVVSYLAGSDVGKVVGYIMMGVYMTYCGFFLQVIGGVIVLVILGQAATVGWFALFWVLLATGGVPFYIDPLAWIAEGIRALQDVFFFVTIPLLPRLAERLERFSFGDSAIPSTYITLYSLFFSKTVISFVITFAVAVALAVPIVALAVGLIKAFMELPHIVLELFQTGRIMSLRQHSEETDSRLTMIQNELLSRSRR